MRVLIVFGHPRPGSLGCALADSFAAGAREAGVEVRELRVGELEFVADVTCSVPQHQDQEPDLSHARRLLLWAEHVVFVYPTWWGSYPARLKGLLDRLLLPGFGFFEEGGRFLPLLGGRTAEIVTTMDTPPWVYRWIYGAPGHRALARATLGFCGIDTVRITAFGPVHTSSEPRRAAWVERARRLGARLREGPRSRAQKLRRGLGTWMKALRPHFYPLTAMGYLVGSLGASRTGAVEWAAFWLGLIVLLGVKAATVLTNEIYDHDSDARNRYWGPFTGGSRALVEGRLDRAALWRGAGIALVAAAVAAVGLLAASPSSALVLATVIVIVGVLALGYTLPPLKLAHRGLGEIDVAVTHSVGVVVFGWVAQGGAWHDPFPWLLSLLIGLAVLPAIILAGFPDRTADAAAGKRTLVVRLGPGWAAAVALASLASAVLIAGLSAGWPRVGGSTWGLGLIAVPHALLVGLALLRYLNRGAPERRIDGLLAASLLFIVWFVAVPLFNLA